MCYCYTRTHPRECVYTCIHAQMVTTASDARAAAREHLVAYKELLLRCVLFLPTDRLGEMTGTDTRTQWWRRQLQEQRELLAAASGDAESGNADTDELAKEAQATAEDVPVVSAEDSETIKHTVTPPLTAAESGSSSHRHRETNGFPSDDQQAKAAAETPAVEAPTNDQAEGGDGRAQFTAAAAASEYTSRHTAAEAKFGANHAKSASVSADNVARKKRYREGLGADAAAAALEKYPMAKRVVRTSVPSKKYLDSRRAQGLSSSPVVQPVLVAATAGSDGQPQDVSPSHRNPSRELSMEQIHGDFERHLRDSVRLSSEVSSRTASMTRKRQLPRLSTPLRQKIHWDYLLEEMKWMATDFSQERNWKRAMQFHLAKDVIVAQNAERVRQEKENRQLAREIASQVSAFWRSMERIAARSRVRFETASGVDASKDGEAQVAEIEAIDEQASSQDGDEGGVVLKYKTIEIASGSAEETLVRLAKERMKKIVSAGRKSREAMSVSAKGEVEALNGVSPNEDAIREVQARASSATGGRTLLAAFQVMALRWMLELYTAGLNMFLNDQLGMGKAATISAFLSLISILDSHAAPSSPKTSVLDRSCGPHLIVVAEEELHKWQFNLRVWRQQWRVQLYEGTAVRRKQLQREWQTKNVSADAASSGQFLNESEGEELWEEEKQPVFCVLCPVNAFVEDQEAFAAFGSWQMFVVESEFDELFDDSRAVAALLRIPQRRRRILCNGRPVESWKSVSLRHQYAEFLLHDAESADWRSDVWTQFLLMDKSCAARAMQSCGKTSSSVTSLLKSSQQVESPDHVGALLVAMYCLALRRVRSEVEVQLGKIEEQSVSCQLSGSQMTQYRNAIAGFASSLSTMNEREERLEMWLQLILRLRVICNCVDIVNDFDKLALADMRMMLNCSAKLDALSSLLARLVTKEEKRVLVYCQFNGMFPILEMFLTLLDVTFVRISGDARMQRRALSHFAERSVVKVALASTRLSCAHGTRAVSVYGADAIVVLDSDWNATCDAKLRASWAKMAVGKEVFPVYRVHCEQTIEASLLRVGACFSEKAISEMTPQELLAVPSDLLVGAALEKPSWWTSNATPGTAAANVIARIGTAAQEVEAGEKYCGDAEELGTPLLVDNVDLDAEEHLLLSNTDELTPVEWYAVDYVHGLTDKKRAHQGGEPSGHGSMEDEQVGEGWTEAHTSSSLRTFDELAALENTRLWQDGDAQQQLFYQMLDSQESFAPVDEAAVEKLFSVLRSKEAEAHHTLYSPPQPPSADEREVFCEPGSTDGNQMMFHISYRVPAPPAPAAVVKIKGEQQSETPGKLVKTKKQRAANATGTGLIGRPPGTGSLSAGVTGVKRKLDQSGVYAGSKSSSTKEQRVDQEGIPLADVAEFEDDDFWGDTNLDALDSASWDDASVLSGILGPAVDSSSGAAASGKAGGASASQDGSGAGAQRTSTKKSKGTTGAGASGTANRVRKGSVSSDSGRDGWTPQDDMVLKKLFELYGSNWTLIAQVFNSTTAVSRFTCKKRTPRQCYDRYGKIISVSLSTSSGANASSVKDGKMSKNTKTSGSGIMVLSSEMLDARIGLPADELLLVFSARNSLPGLPPPSIINVPNLVEMSMRKKKSQKQQSAGEAGGGMDDLKSIRNSFDAIIQCMKRKTTPPPIPIPTPSAASADLSTKASLTAAGAASFTPSPASKTTKTAGSSSQAQSAKTPVTIQPPHKSHTDILSILPPGAVTPDDVIKRSKEVAAVQAAAAVASVGRDPSSLAAAGDAILGAAFGSSSTLNRKHYAGNAVGMGAAASPGAMNARAQAGGVSMASGVPGSKMSTPNANMASSGPAASASSPAWGDMSGLQHMARGVGGAMSTIDLNNAKSAGLAPGAAGLGNVGAGAAGSGSSAVSGGVSGSKAPPMPVTTSTLLHVLDRMPEIKNKIQTILNRNDCSEAQKVTMIARLLSNTNAIANSTVLPASNVNATQSPMMSHQSNAVSVVSSSVMPLSSGETSASVGAGSSAVIDLETPIPMPASLASTPTASIHLPANAALLMESLASSPVSTPNAFPPNPSQP